MNLLVYSPQAAALKEWICERSLKEDHLPETRLACAVLEDLGQVESFIALREILINSQGPNLYVSPGKGLPEIIAEYLDYITVDTLEANRQRLEKLRAEKQQRY